jgi:hypothetical protein
MHMAVKVSRVIAVAASCCVKHLQTAPHFGAHVVNESPESDRLLTVGIDNLPILQCGCDLP